MVALSLTDELEESERKIGFIPAHIEEPVLVKKTEVDLEMGCYVKSERIGDISVVSFDRLTNGTRFCEPFELDFSNHPDIVAVLLRAGQTQNMEAKCLFSLNFSIPQAVEMALQLDTGQLEGAIGQVLNQQKEETPESTVRVVTDEEITNLAGRLPDAKYSKICEELGFDYNYAQKVKTKLFLDSTAAFKEILQEWKDKGGFIVDLDKALRNSDLEGLIHKYKKQK
ncbi:uncharacterized protein LOC135155292 [Lytechinus pictus]|uniref:uncharacterized protein LOC135155292 n=1 Tax=Lytechinus pictus TaxID=7653 RepID=UPI0030B9B69F